MNINIKKLISFLTLEVRNDYVNVVIGYLNSLSDQEGDWHFVVTRIVIELDIAILKLLEDDIDNKIEDIKGYSIVFNNCYSFINEEFKLDFIQQPAFDNNRVNNIKDFNTYILARKTWLKEFK
jgi:hypothetical protein